MSEGTRVVSMGQEMAKDAMARIERLERRDEFHQMLIRSLITELRFKVRVAHEFAESAHEYNEAGRKEYDSATQVAEAA